MFTPTGSAFSHEIRIKSLEAGL